METEKPFCEGGRRLEERGELSKRSDEAQVIKDARDKLKKMQAEQRESQAVGG